jgi:hypothetical protein
MFLVYRLFGPFIVGGHLMRCKICGKSGHFAKDCKECQEEIIWYCEYCDKEFTDEKSAIIM